MIVHSIHYPYSARSFVEPVVAALNEQGIESELWIENKSQHTHITEQLQVPKRLIDSDLTMNIKDVLSRIKKYRDNLRKSKPRVLHVHQTRASLIPLIAAYLEKVPIRIYHNHGLPYLGYTGILRKLLKLIERINIGLATHVLMVSHSNFNEAIADGLLDMKKGTVLAHGSAVGIDLSIFASDLFRGDAALAARKALNIPSDSFILAYVGRPFKRKGFHILLHAWEAAKMEHMNAYLLIAGCTPDECERVLKYSSNHIVALGYQSSLTRLYAAADTVVLPSEHEGFPYSLLEGAAAGKPLIGTDIPGIRCAIIHNKTGLLVPPKDVVALADAFRYMATNKAKREQMGKNARLRIEKEFSRELLINEYMKYYEEDLSVI